jgi:formylglycine-generating enzyme required for sulfatase activity
MTSLDGLGAGEERGQFCWCPPGTFQMGPFSGPPVSGDAVQVTLSSGFWIGKYLVTQSQYEFVMGHNPSGFAGVSLPVETVCKSDADAFCDELNRLERATNRLPQGWEYRLPTEAQWEYACRAGTNTIFSWGDDEKQIDDYAWYGQNSSGRTHAVGQKKPNLWGLYDMHGNCIEWCRDAWRDALPGGTDPEVTKQDVAAHPGWSQTPFWVCRGGSWQYMEPGKLKTRNRERLGPVDRSYIIGFRLALVATPLPR